LEKADSIKEFFIECNGYSSLYNLLQKSCVLDEPIIDLFKEMVSENTNKYLHELVNCDMAVLLVKLMPFFEKELQNKVLDYLCELSTLSHANQLKACSHNLLFNFIDILSNHQRFESVFIERLFRTIQILGCCSISNLEVNRLISYLKPKIQFPYGIQIFRCLIYWAKHTAHVGLNLSLLNIQNDVINDSNSTQLNELSNFTQDVDKTDIKFRKSSIITVNHSVLDSIIRSKDNGAISFNAQHQAKYFFEFQHLSSGIRVPAIKKWPGYGFAFHAWVKLRNDLELFEKKRRQLYSFYTDNGHGFEAFFTPDCSNLIISVSTKKEFVSLQIREIDFNSSQMLSTDQKVTTNDLELQNKQFSNEYWHSVCIVHIPEIGRAHV